MKQSLPFACVCHLIKPFCGNISHTVSNKRPTLCLSRFSCAAFLARNVSHTVCHAEAYLLLPLWTVLGGLFVSNLWQFVHDTLQPGLHSIHIGLVQQWQFTVQCRNCSLKTRPLLLITHSWNIIKCKENLYRERSDGKLFSANPPKKTTTTTNKPKPTTTKTSWANVQMTHIQVQNYTNCIDTSLKYTPVTQSILWLFFLMCVATMHH